MRRKPMPERQQNECPHDHIAIWLQRCADCGTPMTCEGPREEGQREWLPVPTPPEEVAR
jgi:hypothetical protein